MIRKVFQIGVLLLLGIGPAALPAAARAADARLRALSLAASPAAARVTLALSRFTGEHYFTLDRPFRTVVDLPQTRARRTLRLPAGRGLIAGVRMGRRPNGALRLVFVLRAPAAVHADWVYSRARGHQLVLTLGGAQPAIASAAPSAIPTPIRVRHAPANTGRDIIVAVDPGHGGVDPGAIGPDGLEEKNVTLAIGRMLARRIDEQRGMRAVMTRDKDIFIPLRERREIARRAHADLFVSIHADDVSQHYIAGASVYILSLRGASSEAARLLAARENAADLKGGIKLSDKSSTLASVLLNLSQSATISESMTAARQVIASLDRSLPVRKPQVQQAAFVVLKSPDIPSMLIETDYISDPREDLKLRNPAYQRKIADAIFHGIRVYFREHPPAGTLFAEERQRRVDRLVARNR
ncbi:MAG TPA: N-acetylmuramoyl-L-alanine amidase [Steroidobacteraceae bacterium]|nr:N-acetylmuramoyl-L-alanine amidase [Steroidobacteraceae bacterium]